MSRWGFWDWVGYACLGVAAFGLAAGAAMRDQPNLWAKLPDFLTDSRWGYVPAILFALGTFILAVEYVAPLFKRSPPPIQQVKEDEKKPEVGIRTRVVIDVKPDHLMGLYRDHTHIQAEKLAEAYIGKWIKISAQVQNVSALASGITITVKETSLDLIFLRFGIEWADRVTTFQRKQKITVVGEIERIQFDSLVLINCELVETQ